MAYSESQLLDLKSKIDKSKEELADLKANKKVRMQELEKKWGCTDLKQAKRLLMEKKKKLDDWDFNLKESNKWLLILINKKTPSFGKAFVLFREIF